MIQRSLAHVVIASLLLTATVSACRPSSATVESATTSLPPATPTRQPAGAPVVGTSVPDPVSESAIVGIRDRGEVRVGVLYNYPPFSFLTDDGKIEGYEVALARAIADQWGVTPVFVQVTRQTRLPMLASGEIDLIAGAMPHRRELEQHVEFTDTTFLSGYVVLVQSPSGIQDVQQALAGPVAVLGEEAGQALAAYAAAQGLAPDVQIVESLDAARAAMVDQAAVRAIVGRREALMLAASSIPDSQILEDFISTEPYAFAVRRGDTPLRDLLNLTLQQIASVGRFGELFSANFYGYAADPYPTLPGEPRYSFADFPTTIPPGPSVVERLNRGEPLRVAGLDLAAEPQPFDGQPIVDGYNRAVVNEMARRWGVPVLESPGSAGAAGTALLASSAVDMVVGIRPDQSQIGTFAFSEAYYSRAIRMVYMRDVSLFGVGDLEFKPSLAVPPLDVSEAIIRDNNGHPEVTLEDSFAKAFEALTGRGVYAIVGDEFSLLLMVQADDAVAVIDRRYRPVSYVIALPVHDHDFLTLVNITLQDMLVDGTLDRLQQQYFAPYFPPGETLEPFQMEVWPGDGSYLKPGT